MTLRWQQQLARIRGRSQVKITDGNLRAWREHNLLNLALLTFGYEVFDCYTR